MIGASDAHPKPSRWLLVAVIAFVAALAACAPPEATNRRTTRLAAAATPRPTASALRSAPPTASPTPLPTATPAGPVPVVPPSSSPVTGASPAPGLPRLRGNVRLPGQIISDHGLGIISNNGSSIVSNNGGTLISDNGLGLVSDNGLGLISNNGGSYRVMLASGTELGVKGAYMYLTNRDEKFFLDRLNGSLFGATSDANGAYRFNAAPGAGFPESKDAVVNALVGGIYRLTGYFVPGSGESALDVGLASTLSTELLRGEAYRTGRQLSSYDRTLFQRALDDTQAALQTGDIAALGPDPHSTGVVLNFDLRMDQVHQLRNQYVIALSAVDKANSHMRRLSDTWRALLGTRPVAVTTVIGNGNLPTVTNYANDPSGLSWGFATGDHRGLETPGGLSVPLGFNTGVAVSPRGDVFVASYTEAPYTGHIRWIRPDGRIKTLWLPNYLMVQPSGIAIERQPSDDIANAPGSLLVTDMLQNLVLRIAIVDEPLLNGVPAPLHPSEIVAGAGQSDFGMGDHPLAVDGGGAVHAIDPASPASSAWRLSDEGARFYADGTTPVPGPARFAHLHAPTDVTVDELGNIYIAEAGSHRVRMIVGPLCDGQNFFGYRAPHDDDGDGLIDRYDATPTAMKAGAIYTIVGNPRWLPAKTANDGLGRWFGEYHLDGGGASDGVRGQLARLDQPSALAFRAGALYISDFDNQRVRKVARSTGTIVTVAGNPTGAQRGGGTDYDFAPGTAGDGGPAASAQLSYPRGLAFDASGRLFIADTDSGRIRMVDTAGGISSVAGRLHVAGVAPTDNVKDGEARHFADLYDTRFIAVDPSGNLLLNDARHRRLRKVWWQWE